MHRIIQAHLASFASSFGLQADDEATQFEKFAAHCVVSNQYASGFDLDDVVTAAGDDGIDGVAVVIDEVVVSSPEDAVAVFHTTRRNHDVDVFLFRPNAARALILVNFSSSRKASCDS